MRTLLLHTFSLAFPIVVIVLGILVLVGKTVFLPWFVGALVIMVSLLILLFLDRKKTAASRS